MRRDFDEEIWAWVILAGFLSMVGLLAVMVNIG